MNNNVLEDVFVEIFNPLIAIYCFNFQRCINYVFIFKIFTIDPWISIVEFKHIDSFLHCIYTVFDLAWSFFLGQKKSFCLLLTTNFAHIIQSYCYVKTFHCYSVVENRVFLEDLKITTSWSSSLKVDCLPYTDRVIRSGCVLCISDSRLLPYLGH